MNRTLILVSHGTIAEGFLSAVYMMIGKDAPVRAFCLLDTDTSDTFRTKVREGIGDLAGSGVLLLCDILGGSPMTITLQELEKAGIAAEETVGGMNLAMVISAVIARNEADAGDRMIEEARAAAVRLPATVREEEEI